MGAVFHTGIASHSSPEFTAEIAEFLEMDRLDAEAQEIAGRFIAANV